MCHPTPSPAFSSLYPPSIPLFHDAFSPISCLQLNQPHYPAWHTDCLLCSSANSNVFGHSSSPFKPTLFFFVIDSPLLLPYLTTPRLVLVEKQSFYSTLFFLGFHSILWPSFYWARLAVVESKSLNLHLSPRSKFGFRCQKNSHSLLKSKIEEYKMENLSWRCVRWRQIRT